MLSALFTLYRDDAIRTIREMLDTFGDEMSREEMLSHRARLRALY